MRAVGDDLLHTITIHRLDVLLGQHLEEVLVSKPSRSIAGRDLLGAEDGDLDAGRLEDLNQRPGNLLAVVVIAAR